MSTGEKARQSSLQLDNADPLVGIVVNLPRHCQCGHDMCHVGPGRDPHRASLQCARCGRHRGWLSHKTANFLSAVIARFGRPIASVHVRVPSETSNLRIVDNGKASTNVSVLVIETAITDNAPPFNQPWRAHMNRGNRPAETRDHGGKKVCGFVRKPPAVPSAPSALKRCPVRVAARTNMTHVMPATAVSWQVDHDPNERIRIVELQA